VPGVVLQTLARTEQPLTGSKIAQIVSEHSSRAGVTKALKGLVTSGLVECMSAGKSNLYTLNRQHLAAGAVITLAHLREQLLERIAQQANSWTKPAEAIWLYGSTARSDGGSDSDIDILLVRQVRVDYNDSDWLEQILKLTEDVRAWTGNNCQVLEYTVKELQELSNSQDPLVASLLRDAILISGRTTSEVLANS
jgi:predicted nucleotidyltransferase